MQQHPHEQQQQQHHLHRRIGSSSSDQNLTTLWRRIGVTAPTATSQGVRPGRRRINQDDNEREVGADDNNHGDYGTSGGVRGGDGGGQHSPLHFYDYEEREEQEASPLSHHRSGHDNVDPLLPVRRRTAASSPQQPQAQSNPPPSPSPWTCDSTTPMTTRPHFPSHRDWGLEGRPIRRVRSRSLGSSLEDRRGTYRRTPPILPSLLLSPTLLIPPNQRWHGSQQVEKEGTMGDGDAETTRLVVPIQRQPSAAEPTTNRLDVNRNEDPHGDAIRLSVVPIDALPPTEQVPANGFDDDHDHDHDNPLLGKPDMNPDAVHMETTNPLWICVLYGFINATIVLPVLMSFASIIYRDPAFAPYMPVLVRLTMMSGIVHQLCFSALSSLPFAVGQVQDAGLIFLSSMASTIVQSLSQTSTPASSEVATASASGAADSAAVLLATTTVTLSLGTTVLGVGLVIIGTLGLARYVQLLPTSVIGGYLAYIGYFCGASGVELMASGASAPINTANSNEWESLVSVLKYVLPGVLGGCIIYYCVRRFRHMAVLPTCICLELVLFYLVLALTGTTVDQVTDLGWIRRMDDPPPWYQTWEYLKFDRVEWSVLPPLAVTELSMIFVVALSSSLDVAAIELELRRPLNYNHELSTVGVSNVVSGLTGGYTGSYIFSQSIFSLRAGIRSRKAGFALAATQLAVLLLPFNLLAYIPNFFFGSLLSLICVDLLYEWLWEVRHRLTKVEYVVCLATFGSIQAVGVEYGILTGVILYVLSRKLGLDVGRNVKHAEWSSAPSSTEPSPRAMGSAGGGEASTAKASGAQEPGALSGTQEKEAIMSNRTTYGSIS